MVRRADLGGDVDRGALELGGFHLARDGAQPDQLVEPGLVVIEHLLDVFRAAGARSVGRIASWASCAFFDFETILARRGRHVVLAVVGCRSRWRAAVIASGAMSTPSVRI